MLFNWLFIHTFIVVFCTVLIRSEPILLLPDYNSFVLNCCKGDLKVIAACFTLLVSTLKDLKPALMYGPPDMGLVCLCSFMKNFFISFFLLSLD
jgi:hypothetical protein